MYRSLCLSLLVTASSIGCGGIAPTVEVQASGNELWVGNYRTYAIVGPAETAEGYRRQALDEANTAIAVNQFRLEMDERGFLEVPASEADLLVYGATGARLQPSSSARFANVADVPEATLVVEIFERSSGEPVWEASISNTVVPRQVDEERLRRAVTLLLEQLPSAADANTGDEAPPTDPGE